MGVCQPHSRAGPVPRSSWPSKMDSVIGVCMLFVLIFHLNSLFCFDFCFFLMFWREKNVKLGGENVGGVGEGIIKMYMKKIYLISLLEN